MGIRHTIRIGLAALALGSLLAPARAGGEAPKNDRVIDLAICLDTSGSMEGLIDAARRRIWTIVNDLATAKPTPRLRVALLAYGGDDFDAGAGWVQVQTPFTEDLDLVSNRLFALRTKGGTELVGRVLQKSLEMEWQADKNALKLIIVAGNESADQDKEVSFRDMCRAAIARGIMVNALYCVRNESVESGWKEIARLSDGQYAAIDDRHGTVAIASPYDTQLATLSQNLNDTYVPFGRQGDKGKREQKAQDANAEGLALGAAADRALSKAGKLYRNAWCLVDATRSGQVKLEDLKEEDLPEALRGKTHEEQQAFLDAKWAAREKIQKEIAELGKQRDTWLAKEMEKLAKDGEQSFDKAVRRQLREQAEAKGFAFETEK